MHTKTYDILEIRRLPAGHLTPGGHMTPGGHVMAAGYELHDAERQLLVF